MKTAIPLVLWLALAAFSAASAQDRYVSVEFPNTVNSNSVTVSFIPRGELPEFMAVVVQRSDVMDAWEKNQRAAMEKWRSEFATNHNARPPSLPPPPQANYSERAKWIPFSTNLIVDLGPGDGKRELMHSIRYKGEAPSGSWSGSSVTVRTWKPFIVITEPRANILSQPMIQLKGFSPVPLENIHYDVLNQDGVVTKADQQGYVNDQYMDPVLFSFTTNYFSCYDIDLSPGTNTIVFHATDDTGNSIETNFIFVFSTAGVANGPSLKPVWPERNETITGSAFSLRGYSDDFTAHIVALIVNPDGKAVEREAQVERNGRCWVDDIPLSEGRTDITLIANNAAGYSTVTNLSVRKGRGHLEMDPVVPNSRLWLPRLTITGTSSFAPSNYTVWVNGVKATLYTNGTWKADNVPIPEGGVATFDMKAIPNSGHDEGSDPDPYPTVPITWGAPTNGIQWGIYLAASDTNHMNRQHCELYVVNMSGVNMNFHWMRPKPETLNSLHLFDMDGKEIPKSYSGRASFGGTETVLPPATELDLHHLDTKAIALIDGVLPLGTNAPVRVASFDVMDQYNHLPFGGYHLQIAGRLYQIKDSGKLSLLEAAPMTLPLEIVEQPSELIYHLRHLQSQGKFSWGESTNLLRAGIAHNFEPQTVIKGDQVEVFLMNDSTNDLHDLLLPTPDQRFDISLYDPLGNGVPKTALGEQQGKPLSLAADAPGATAVFLAAKDAAKCNRFNLNSIFEIKAPGVYRVAYQQRLYQIKANGIVDGITLPPVTVAVEIQ
jgi:hypothetical protein